MHTGNNKVLSFVRSLWPFGTKATTKPEPTHLEPEGDDLPLNAKPTQVGITLDPAVLLRREDALPALKLEAVVLATKYPEIEMYSIFENVVAMFVALFTEYRDKAARVLVTALEAIKSAEMPATIDIEKATEELKGNLKSLAEKRLDAIDMLTAKAAETATAFRTLTIGITGNPAILPVLTVLSFTSVLPIIAGITVSMLFEVVFNAPLLQDKANLDIANMFSVLVSLAGTFTVFMAGRAMRILLNHRNATTEHKTCFPNGSVTAVFPMSGDAQFERRFWHAAMLFVVSATLVIRYIMASEVGDMAGSAGVLFVFIVLYGWEAKYAMVNHPRTAECLAKKAEAEEAEADLKALKGDIASPEAKAAFNTYTATLTTREGTERKKAETRNKAAETFLRLANQFLASPAWFTEQLRETFEGVVSNIGAKRTESDDELSAMTKDVKPEFKIDTPFNLTEETVKAKAITANVEIKGRRITAAEFEKTLLTITADLTKERTAAKVAAEATKHVAPALKTPNRSGWKAPRL